MVLLILAVLWAAVLVPPALRARAESSPVDSIGSFRKQLHVLQRTSPNALAPTPAYRRPRVSASARSRKRRRDILVGLLGAMALTLLLALVGVGGMLALHALVDLLFVGYVALLIRTRNIAAEREMKVRFLPSPTVAGGRAHPQPALLLRRISH